MTSSRGAARSLSPSRATSRSPADSTPLAGGCAFETRTARAGSRGLDDQWNGSPPDTLATMTDSSGELDVVVLGGGGHVGLPLSLVLAEAGFRVGIYDTNP